MKLRKPRNRSISEMKAYDHAVNIITTVLGQPYAHESQAMKVQALVSRVFGDKEVPAAPTMFWTCIKDGGNRFNVRRANQRYLQAIIEAYAVYEHIIHSSQFEVHLKLIAEAARHPITSPRFNLLKEVLLRVIDYSFDQKGHQKIDSKTLSRDCKAMQHLINLGIKSYEVFEYQDEHGGGLDSWSRDNDAPVARKKMKQAFSKAGFRPSKRRFLSDGIASQHFFDKHEVKNNEILAIFISRSSEGDAEILSVEKKCVPGPRGMQLRRIIRRLNEDWKRDTLH